MAADVLAPGVLAIGVLAIYVLAVGVLAVGVLAVGVLAVVAPAVVVQPGGAVVVGPFVIGSMIIGAPEIETHGAVGGACQDQLRTFQRDRPRQQAACEQTTRRQGRFRHRHGNSRGPIGLLDGKASDAQNQRLIKAVTEASPCDRNASERDMQRREGAVHRALDPGVSETEIDRTSGKTPCDADHAHGKQHGQRQEERAEPMKRLSNFKRRLTGVS